MTEFVEAIKGGVTGTGSRRDATLIREGWGSSGYYDGEMLQRDIPKHFGPGTKMYVNHATAQENSERPEGDVRYLAGKIIEAPRYAGAEMKSVIEIYPHWAPVIDAMAEDIGVSIRAEGVVEAGAAGGKEGQIVKEITRGISVDFVTEAGAGGKVGPLIESAIKADHEDSPLARVEALLQENEKLLSQLKEAAPAARPKGDDLVMAEISEAELSELRDKEKRLAEAEEATKQAEAKAEEEKARGDRAEDKLRLSEAKELVAKACAEGLKGMPVRAVERACAEAMRDLPVKEDGSLDEPALKERAVEAAKREREYLGESSGGKVTGLGESAITGGGDRDVEAEMAEFFQNEMGLSETKAKIAAKGR